MPKLIALLAFTTLVTIAFAPTAGSGSLPKLSAKVGPGFTITLKNAAGRQVKTVKAGTYVILVTDRSGDDQHNFHLVGPGVRRTTSVPFTGTRRWTVTFRKGKTYRFQCDPHSLVMKGTFRAV